MPTEMGKSLASKAKHQFMYALIFIGGRSVAYLFLYILAGVYSVLPSVFKRSQAYIARRFKPTSRWQFFKHTYLLNLTFGRTLVDRAALGILGRTGVQSTQQERQQLIDWATQRKGALLLTAHVGCWQMAVNLTGFIPTKLHVLYYRHPQDYDKTVAQHSGQAAPFDFIDPSGPLGGVVEMMSALQKGEIVCAMADRVFGNEKNAVTVDFLGGKMRVPFSFYKLAAATGAPLGILFFSWEGKGVFRTHTCPPLQVNPKAKTAADFIPYAQQFASALEEFCIKYPYQFFNYFNVWSDETNGG